MTVVLGLVLGCLMAVSTHRLAAALVFLVASLFMVVQVAMSHSRFGLPRAGYEWGPLHWGSFGLCAAIVFASVLVVLHTSVPATPLSSIAGVVVALVMGAAAWLPRRRSSGEA